MGSNPVQGALFLKSHIVVTICSYGVMERKTVFETVGPGSIPGRNTYAGRGGSSSYSYKVTTQVRFLVHGPNHRLVADPLSHRADTSSILVDSTNGAIGYW